MQKGYTSRTCNLPKDISYPKEMYLFVCEDLLEIWQKPKDETRFERVTYRTAAGCSTPELFVQVV